ncbi:E3.1.3.1 [Lepeophtheirus salmonis]|uniref:alkaline phosphatase n=1 Tax=Lepeophtheirus salmonis TaxID=72036 RepID=A0A7R8CM19_LEPSM|nr:E3.1.3.1 [Lepeophtheirus salmonis]CAF2861279.1 E3.1.3.1 [Lepeophtheirus salmonis]
MSSLLGIHYPRMIYKAFVQDKFLLGKEFHDTLEPVGRNTELRRLEGNFVYETIAQIQRANRRSLWPILGTYEDVNKFNSLFKTDLSTDKWSQGAEGIKKVGLLFWGLPSVPAKDSSKKSIMFDSSYNGMDLKFLLSNDSMKAILELSKTERSLNNVIKGIKFQKRNFRKMNPPPKRTNNREESPLPGKKERSLIVILSEIIMLSWLFNLVKTQVGLLSSYPNPRVSLFIFPVSYHLERPRNSFLISKQVEANTALQETMMLDNAIEKTLELVDTEDMLIIVTSDHGHTMSYSGFGGDGNDKKKYNLLSYANGIGVNNHYRVTNGKIEHSEYHSGADVGIFAIGPWSHLIHSVHEQSYINTVMAYSACLGDYTKEPHCNKCNQVSIMDKISDALSRVSVDCPTYNDRIAETSFREDSLRHVICRKMSDVIIKKLKQFAPEDDKY